MKHDYAIKPPFFEIGPKAYLYGHDALELAKVAEEASKKYDVRVVLTPQPTDIALIAKETSDIYIFAQHMDPLPIGRGMGSILPEALKAAGAHGVMLNHAEKPVTLTALSASIQRAKEVGLISMICADTIDDARAIACLGPDIIVTEPTELIGTGTTSDKEYIKATTDVIKSINPKIQVLQGAGISSGEDVYSVIKAGAEATGCTSGIIKAEDPYAMIYEMLSAAREAWDEVHS